MAYHVQRLRMKYIAWTLLSLLPSGRIDAQSSPTPSPSAVSATLPPWEIDVAPGYYVDPTVQPETPILFLKRLRPRVERDATVKRLYEELNHITIPVFELHDTPLLTACEQVNHLIQHHNDLPGAFAIPPVKLNPKLLAGIPSPPGSTNGPFIFPPASTVKVGITETLKNVPLMQVIQYVATFGDTYFEVEPDAIWLNLAGTSGIYLRMTHSYIIPKEIFSTQKQEKGILDTFHFAPGDVSFDEHSHILTVNGSDPIIGEFEVWYAHKLLEHGYSFPSTERKGAAGE